MEWRAVPDWPGYTVSPDGVLRGPSGRVLKVTVSKSGHLEIMRRMKSPRRNRKLRVHHAVLTAFVGPRPDGLIARHLNGVPADNRVENLVWGTYGENGDDAVRHGTVLTGEAGGGRLTDAQAEEVRCSPDSSRVLARRYGVSHVTIQKIKRGERYG